MGFRRDINGHRALTGLNFLYFCGDRMFLTGELVGWLLVQEPFFAILIGIGMYTYQLKKHCRVSKILRVPGKPGIFLVFIYIYKYVCMCICT